MKNYLGRHADLYDLFHSSKAYKDEAAFVHRCLVRNSTSTPGRLLELACGTGTHACELARLGYKVLALDNSPDMLRVARIKAADSRPSVEFQEQDMRSLAVGEDEFDAAVCLFDSIGYVQTDEGLEEVLRGVWRSLKADGLFLFEAWHAPAMLGGYDRLRVRRFPLGGGQVLRIAETELQREQSLARVRYSIYDLRGDGTYDQFEETHTNRFFTVPELRAWASRTGFDALKSYGGFSEEREVDPEAWHVVSLWRKVTPYRIVPRS